MDISAVVVYCSSSPQLNPVYYAAGTRLGEILADRGVTLIFGGADMGLMKAVCDAVLENGGQAVGVIPRRIYESKGADSRLSELVIVDDIRTRKQIMEDRASAIIALPGGIGTMDEFFEGLVQKQLGFHAKPICIANINGYFERLLEFLDQGVRQHFMVFGEQNLFHVVQDVEEIFPYFDTCDLVD